MLIKIKEKYNIYGNKSNIAGSGIFISESIKKGECVDLLEGRSFVWKYEEPRDRSIGANWIGLDKNEWVDPEFPFSHINHSCKPNLGMKEPRKFYALRDIIKGEELTFDYSTTDEVLDWKLECLCGQDNCRKYISGIQELPLDIFESYLPFIPETFQNIYREYNKLK